MVITSSIAEVNEEYDMPITTKPPWDSYHVDFDNLIKSQCVKIYHSHNCPIPFDRIRQWLSDNLDGNFLRKHIPYYSDFECNVSDSSNEWATQLYTDKVVVWIPNKNKRIEFILTWA